MTRCRLEKYIKAAEQRWDVLTQHIHSETVMNIIDKRHKTTLLGIIQKINMKLVDEKTIVLGFATSQKPSGYDDTKLVAVGFASNCLDDTHKFLDGYKYVENGKDVYGKHLAEILETALKAKKRQTELKPEKVIIYFHGVNEALFPIGNRQFCGTTKPTKYAIIYDPEPVNMEEIQILTNDLCYDSQIIWNPVSVPAPIAMDCAERGSAIIFVNNGLYLKRETRKVDYERTNEEYTYTNKNLGNTRFNS